MSRRTGPTPATVELVLARDWECCVSCGRPNGPERGYHWSLQHRVARGSGGTSRLELSLPANLIVLCGSATTPGGCHARVERRGVEDRTAGYWLLRDTNGHPTMPAEIPVYHAAYGWCFLDDAGNVTPAVSGVAA